MTEFNKFYVQNSETLMLKEIVHACAIKFAISGASGTKGWPGIVIFRILEGCLMCPLVHVAVLFVSSYPVLFSTLHLMFPFHHCLRKVVYI
jgi:hypothetical protein